MPLGEFELIDRYFKRPARRAALGVGDDCALLRVKPGMSLAISSDMLVEGRHFLSTVRPERLGHKALAVNLSDLAACGARPLAFTLALSLPSADPDFLADFATGLFRLADEHDCELIGGDTTAGPLNICITVFGEVPVGAALLRSGALPGDDLYVSGQPGHARIALEVFRGTLQADGEVFETARMAMEMPTPRVELGLALRGIATSAVDVSDGLIGDLGHILDSSAVGATLDVDALPESALLTQLPPSLRRQFTLAGGDDYELLFTARRGDRQAVVDAAWAAQTPVTRIGVIQASEGLRLVDGRGCPERDIYARFDHFKT
ncbi:thiamine-phosphate kinase [Methylibium petroleiphilum]|uniref:thiamine-phosphate kinase n=1 Tax=Methylibium petroleiphilum TaxID=105560 RepID=UPI003D2CEC3E